LVDCNSVIDPFLGSGPTAVACERLKRKWIGIEIEEKYCEISAKRIELERKQLKLF
jgi:DNA modification methylase